MKKYFYKIQLLALLSVITLLIPYYSASAQDDVEESQLYRREFDLDQDGNPEFVEIVPNKIRIYKEGQKSFKEIPYEKNYTNNEAFFEVSYQLRVIKEVGSKKKVVWKDTKNEFSFIHSDLGIEYINCVGDIDGDGTVELVSNAAQSDISPAFIRILTWKNNQFNWSDSTYYFGTIINNSEPYTVGNEFKPVSGNLMDEYFDKEAKKSKIKDKSFVWIMNLLEVESPGVVIADIYSSDGYYGKAEMKRVNKAFKIVKWIEEMKKLIN